MKRFHTVIVVALVLIVFLAIQDIQGLKMWESLDGFSSEAYEKAEPKYMQLFWGFAYSLIAVTAGIYYLFRKDKSETLALAVVFFGTLWGGLEDVLYYLFQGKWLDASMPWLVNKMPGLTANLFGLETVTPLSLLVNLCAFSIATIYIVKKLEKARW